MTAQFYASPEDEAAALRRAAARAGCRVGAVRRQRARIGEVDGASVILGGAGADQLVGSLTCSDGWGAARLLLALADEDARTPGARAMAERLGRGTSSAAEYAARVHALGKRVPFRREQGEIFQSGAMTLNANVGDCDDHFRLVYALAVAGGLRAGLAVLHHGAGAPPDKAGPAHALAVFDLGSGWVFAETTVAAELGENPNDAARRLGLATARTDIAKEVVIMTEDELPPVPAGFEARAGAAQTSWDAEALQRLGYLAADLCAAQVTDPVWPPFRRAVMAFQAARGLGVDGLMGPVTRGRLETELAASGVTMGALVTSLTSDLSDDFLRLVAEMADRFRAQGATAAAEDWLLVWSFESDIRNVPNRAGQPYAGLNQMGVKERAACGFTGSTAQWLALSLVEQMPFVDCYYRSAAVLGHGPKAFRGAASLYLANLAPADLPHSGDPSFAVYSAPSGNYEANKGLDHGNKGFISVDDCRLTVESRLHNPRFLEARARIRALGAAPAVALAAPSNLGTVAGVLLVLGTLGAAGWVAWQS